MDCSISSLTFKGSVGEAILEAKSQRKLFVVYISGEDEHSIRMESSTWKDRNVAESLTNYCIFLQFSEGSTDAARFSAIYPQKSAPCITAVGYNGVQIWQNESFVCAEDLASTLEKAWLSLHIQETTAIVLSAVLASRQSDTSTSASSDMSSIGEESSIMDIASHSTGRDVHSMESDEDVDYSDARPVDTSEIVEENKGCDRAVEETTRSDMNASTKPSYFKKLGSSKDEQPASTRILSENTSEKVDLNNYGVGHDIHTNEEVCSSAPEEKDNIIDCPSRVSQGTSSVVTYEFNQIVANRNTGALENKEAVPDNKTASEENKEPGRLDISAHNSSDVHLNIRLLNGCSLQVKFPVTTCLRIVKDYIDKSQESSFGLYDLAIPYPRKVFNDLDLSKSLWELGLFNRQALIVVPHNRASIFHSGGSSSLGQTNSTPNIDSSAGSNGGYFAYLRNILSYLNPFSYIGGRVGPSSSGLESRNSTLQYGSNPEVETELRGPGRPYNQSLPSQTTPNAIRNDRKSSSQPTRSRFGSNIHTLKRDEDDDQFSDRNAFWNGNSTQYGGDNDD